MLTKIRIYILNMGEYGQLILEAYLTLKAFLCWDTIQATKGNQDENSIKLNEFMDLYFIKSYHCERLS